MSIAHVPGFSIEWDDLYRAGCHQSAWPWSDLVSLVCRYSPIRTQRLSVLELGCGFGANIPFFRAVGADYSGIDGSAVVVDQVRSRFPELSNTIKHADFSREFPFDQQFELIVDRASVTANCTEAIRRTLGHVRKALLPNGVFVGVGWYSTGHSEYKSGEAAEDSHTRKGFESGALRTLAESTSPTRRTYETCLRATIFSI